MLKLSKWLDQKGVIHLIPLLLLLAGIIAGVYLVQHPQIFKPKAYDDSQIITIIDSYGVNLEKVSDHNVYLLIKLPKDWRFREPTLLNPFVKEVFAQPACPKNPGDPGITLTFDKTTYDRCVDDKGGSNTEKTLCKTGGIKFRCYYSENPECISGVSPSDYNYQCPRLSCPREGEPGTTKTFEYDTYDMCIDDKEGTNTQGTLCAGGATRFRCYYSKNDLCISGVASTDFNYPCPVSTSTPLSTPTPAIPQEPSPIARPSPTTHTLKELRIENKDTDGASGGDEPRIITSNFNEYFSRPLQWKLNVLNDGQTEAKRVIQVTFSSDQTQVSFATTITLIRAVAFTPAPSFILRETSPIKFRGGPGGESDSNSPAHWDGNTLYVFNAAYQTWRTAGVNLTQQNRDYRPISFENPSFDGGIWLESTHKEGDTLYGWYHHEPLNIGLPDKLTAPRIGAAYSTDNGLTWHDLGFVIEAPSSSFNPDTENKYFAGGNGDFSVILDEEKKYFYFLISTYHKNIEEQGIAVARMKYENRDDPVGKVWKWSEGKWEEDGMGGRVTPIFKALKNWHNSDADVLWGPSVHFNTYLNMYVMLMNHAKDANWTQEGTYISFNPNIADPFGWTTPKLIHTTNHWYPQVMGVARFETDKRAGRVVRYFEAGESRFEMVFLKPGEPLLLPLR